VIALGFTLTRDSVPGGGLMIVRYLTVSRSITDRLMHNYTVNRKTYRMFYIQSTKHDRL